MKLLILGGTVYLGRHLVEAALERGHEVTLFTRGRHNPELFPEAEKLRGDRDGDLAALRGRRWEAVVDTSGHLPRHVRASAALLAPAVAHYTFISSVFAYAGYPATPGLDEHAPLGAAADPTDERVTIGTLGPLKALCERAAEEAFAGRLLTVRPGLIVGPHDPSGHFAYWPHRVARGGDVLVPCGADVGVQLVDVRDLAQWILGAVEDNRVGAYNATGPAYPLTMRRLLEVCALESGSDARFTWVADDFLLAAGVRPHADLPLWMPGARGAAAVRCEKAIAAGLTFRSLGETVRDTIAWDAGSPSPARRVGLTPEREAQLLRAWQHARSGAAPAQLAPAQLAPAPLAQT